MKPRTRCYEWRGKTNIDGYARIRNGDRLVFVHRLVWEAAHGPLRGEQRVLHSCDNPPCYRLSHLFLGTQLDNIQDMILKGRKHRQSGEGNSHAKLTAADVAEIRRLYATGTIYQHEIARRFGVGQSHVSRIVKGDAW